MGPLTCLAIFKQVFEDVPEEYKTHMAPMVKTLFTDVLGQLNCITDTCDDLQDRKDAVQYVLDYVEPYIDSGGGGGGSS